MKRFNLLLALAIFAIAFSGCTSTTTDEPLQEEGYEEISQEEQDVVAEQINEYEESLEEALDYENEEFGFGLTFPEEWKGYKVTDKADVLYFGFVGYTEIFAISIYTHDEWDALPENQPNPEYLGENDEFVFAGSGSHDSADEFEAERRGEVSSILDTFVVLD